LYSFMNDVRLCSRRNRTAYGGTPRIAGTISKALIRPKLATTLALNAYGFEKGRSLGPDRA